MSAPDPWPQSPVFAAPWEAQAFAMVVALHRRGLFSWGEWSAALAREIAAHGAEDGDYGHWLDALEVLVVAKGVAGVADMRALQNAWAEAAEATPHGREIVLGARSERTG